MALVSGAGVQPAATTTAAATATTPPSATATATAAAAAAVDAAAARGRDSSHRDDGWFVVQHGVDRGRTVLSTNERPRRPSQFGERTWRAHVKTKKKQKAKTNQRHIHG